LREYSSSLDAAYAAEVLGDIARDEGRLDDAAAWYRASLELGRSGTTGTVHISLAEVLNQEGDFDAALRALDMVRVAKLTMNSAMFRWNAALAESALGVGEQDVARAAAVRALRLLAAPDQFSRHPGVGRAEASSDQRARLETISIGRA
jgi:predicted Zn-dependent protease